MLCAIISELGCHYFSHLWCGSALARDARVFLIRKMWHKRVSDIICQLSVHQLVARLHTHLHNFIFFVVINSMREQMESGVLFLCRSVNPLIKNRRKKYSSSFHFPTLPGRPAYTHFIAEGVNIAPMFGVLFQFFAPFFGFLIRASSFVHRADFVWALWACKTHTCARLFPGIIAALYKNIKPERKKWDRNNL